MGVDFEEYTDFVGLGAYRKLEDEYLPPVRLAAKYAETAPLQAAAGAAGVRRR